MTAFNSKNKWRCRLSIHMITVDCRDVESVLHELAIYVSDQVAAVPAMKLHQFVLAPIMDEDLVDQNQVITSIKEFLESKGVNRNFGVIANGDIITIKSLFGKKIERLAKPAGEMFSCAHCGHVTRYEVEHNNHVKIHYL